MPKLDFSVAPSQEMTPQRCEFDSPLGALSMLLRPLSDRQADASLSRRDELVRRYVSGGWIDDDGKFQEKPDVYMLRGEALPLVGGLNERTIAKVAKVEAMQAGRPDDRYLLDDLVLIMERAPDTWQAICVKCVEIQASYVPGKAWPVPSESPTMIASDLDSPA